MVTRRLATFQSTAPAPVRGRARFRWIVNLLVWLKGRNARVACPLQEQELKKAPGEPLEELRPEER